MIPCTWFYLRIALAFLVPLPFHRNFRIILFVSIKESCWNFHWYALNLHIKLGRIGFLTVSKLLVHVCGISLFISLICSFYFFHFLSVERTSFCHCFSVGLLVTNFLSGLYFRMSWFPHNSWSIFLLDIKFGVEKVVVFF